MPDQAHGKICYVEIPALDISKSSSFYTSVFEWTTRTRGDGSLAFDDATGQVSGTWVTGRHPSDSPGLLIYIMVNSVEESLEAVIASGGSVAMPSTKIGPMVIARFRDPFGNVLGLYQDL